MIVGESPTTHLGRETPAPARKPASDMALWTLQAPASWPTRTSFDLVLCCSVSVQHMSHVVWPQLVLKLLATWRCWRDPSSKGLNPPHRREYSGNTCQGNHIPDAPANVNIKSSARIRAR